MRLPGILSERQGLSNDEWYTPRYIIDAIGLKYDLDVCGPKGGVPWIPANETYTESFDGLTAPWYGRVWMNPPYSETARWVERFSEHRPGVALVPADTASKWWHRWALTVTGIVFLRDRVQFVQPESRNVTSARFPSALLATGKLEAQAIKESDLGWYVGEW